MEDLRELQHAVIDERYRLDRELGSGSMGAVFAATQLSVDRLVAVKVLHPKFQQRRDFRQRFELEARAVARLDHPNCITLFDFGYCSEQRVFFMAMEFVEGEPLADMMEAGEIPTSTVLDIAFQISEVLVHAHKHGVLHRDLKPENIMIQETDSGRRLIKVLDFGLARLFAATLDDDSTNQRLTQEGHVYGTPVYMSPEQSVGSRDIGPRTDLYSMGVILYELFEGKPPYLGTSAGETMQMHIRDEIPTMVSGRPPAEVEDLIYQMLEKDPDDRPMSAADVMGELFKFARPEPSREMSLSSIETTDAEEIEELDDDSIETSDARSVKPRVPTLPPQAKTSGERRMEAPTEIGIPAQLPDDPKTTWLIIAMAAIMVLGGGVIVIATSGGDEGVSANEETDEVPARPNDEPQSREEPLRAEMKAPTRNTGKVAETGSAGQLEPSPDAGQPDSGGESPSVESDDEVEPATEAVAPDEDDPTTKASPSNSKQKEGKKQYRTLDLTY